MRDSRRHRSCSLLAAGGADAEHTGDHGDHNCREKRGHVTKRASARPGRATRRSLRSAYVPATEVTV